MFELVGQRIRKFRIDRKISQEELAARVGISRNHLGEIERAETNASLETLERICNELEILPEQLFKHYDYISNVKNPQIILSLIDLLEDKPLELQKELLQIIKILIKWIERFRSKK